MGSWKIMAMRLPRMARIRSRLRVVSSWPSKRIEPLVSTRVVSSSRRSTLNAVTDLPEPDSPTRAWVRPASTRRLTPHKARTGSDSRSPGGKVREKLSMVSSGSMRCVCGG